MQRLVLCFATVKISRVSCLTDLSLRDMLQLLYEGQQHGREGWDLKSYLQILMS